MLKQSSRAICLCLHLLVATAYASLKNYSIVAYKLRPSQQLSSRSILVQGRKLTRTFVESPDSKYVLSEQLYLLCITLCTVSCMYKASDLNQPRTLTTSLRKMSRTKIFLRHAFATCLKTINLLLSIASELTLSYQQLCSSDPSNVAPYDNSRTSDM